MLLALFFFIHGCVGIAAKGNRSATVLNPNISKDKGKLGSEQVSDNFVTSKELLEYWGKPDKIEPVSNGEKWTYNFDLRWNGLIAIIVIIPIPLVFPVGYEYVSFTIENDNLVAAYMMNSSGETGVFYGYFPPHFKGCQAPYTLGDHDNKVLFNFGENDKSKLLRAMPGK
jgi:hypothetical protein